MNATLSKKLFLATVQQYAVDFMIEEGFAKNGIETHEQWLLDTAMRAIRISFKYPAYVLQQDRIIARYPATLWSHLLHSIGLKRYARYAVVKLNEHLAFPDIEIPEKMKVGMKVLFDYHTVIE
jgi:hypothetical protein